MSKKTESTLAVVTDEPTAALVSAAELALVPQTEERAQMPQWWDALPGFPAAFDRYKEQLLKYQQAAGLSEKERHQLFETMQSLCISASRTMEQVMEAFFETEMRQSCRPWAEICAKYRIKGRKEPTPAAKAHTEAARLKLEAEEAIARAGDAAQKAEADQQMLTAANAAVRAAETALAEARDYFQQSRQQLAENQASTLTYWGSFYAAQRGGLYTNRVVLEAMVADIPNVEKELVATLEAAKAHYAKLRADIAE